MQIIRTVRSVGRLHARSSLGACTASRRALDVMQAEGPAKSKQAFTEVDMNGEMAKTMGVVLPEAFLPSDKIVGKTIWEFAERRPLEHFLMWYHDYEATFETMTGMMIGRFEGI